MADVGEPAAAVVALAYLERGDRAAVLVGAFQIIAGPVIRGVAINIMRR